MARHGENIYRRKDGRYEGRYVIGRSETGKTKFGYVYARQYAQVRRLLAVKKAQYFAEAEAGRKSWITLAEWMEYWLRSELLGSVKDITYQRYRAQIFRHILPELGACALGQLTPLLVRAFVECLQASGLRGNTLQGIYRLLAAAMRFAQDEGVVRKNPCARVRLHCPQNGEQRVFSRAEQEVVRRCARSQKDLPVLLSLYTGMRLGEVCALKWSDVDWDNQTIAVRRTVQRVAGFAADGARSALVIDAPKSRTSQRVLPVPAFILEALRAFYEQSAHPAPYVFGRAEAAAEPRTLQRHCHLFLRRLGIEGAHFHTLRHTFATRLIELGVDIKTVSALLGHASTRTTLDFYAHSLLDQQRSAMTLLAAC